MAALGPAAVPGGGQQEAFPHKLYIAGVPKDYTVEQLQPTFDPYGEVVNAVILIEKGGTGMSRGCAFISYATEAQAQAAVTALDNQMTLPGAPYNLRVRFAQKPRDTLSTGPPASNVLTEVDRRRLFFTRGPPGIQAITVNSAFSPYGEIEEINLFPERDQNTTKGCGFVQYVRHEDAAAAMSQLQGSLQLEGVAQKLTVSWADPERRMLKRKFQDGNAGPNPNFQRSMLNVAPGEEREVFFAKIPRAATEQQLGELFTRHGGPVEHVKIFTAVGAPHHKCCGLATFMTHTGASNAILALDGIYLWPNFTDPMVVKWMDHSMSKTRRAAPPGSAQGPGMNGNRMARPAAGPYGNYQQQQYQQMPQQQPIYGQDQYGYSQQMQPMEHQWQYQHMAPQPMYAQAQAISQKPTGQLQQQSYGQAATQPEVQQTYAQQGTPPAMYSTNGQQRAYAPGRQTTELYTGQYGATAQAQKVPSAYTAHPVVSQGGYAQDTQAAPALQQPQQYVMTQAYAPAQQTQGGYQDSQQQYYSAAPQEDQGAQSTLSPYGQVASIGGAAVTGSYGSSAAGGSQLFPIQLQQRGGVAGRG